MENLIENLPWIVLVTILICICYRLWKRGRLRDPGQENTYFAATKKREPFECPYDLESCDYVDTSTMTIAIQCQDCKRYNKGIQELRDKLNKIIK